MFLQGSYKHLRFNTSQTHGVTSLSPAHQTCFPSVPLADIISSSPLHPSSGLISLGNLQPTCPPTSSVTKSYQFYFLKILQTVPDSLSLSVTFAPGHNFIQFIWSPCLQMHPLKSPPCPITYPSLKCSGTSSFLNVQASTMTPEPPDQALAHHYDLFL